MPGFNPEKATNHIKNWIRKWFDENGADKTAVIGISGGKDSTICAKLLADVLGPDHVLGVLMPNSHQPDLDEAIEVVKMLGIRGIITNIESVVDATHNCLKAYYSINECCMKYAEIGENARINTPPRNRMTVLYGYAAQEPNGGFVVNTCNASEDYIGYSTKYGDSAGDFSPLANYTVTEILAIGRYLGLPEKFVAKTPSDGLCGQTDEEKIGFTYAMLDEFIRTGVCPDPDIRNKIIRMHKANLHKINPMPACPYLAA